VQRKDVERFVDPEDKLESGSQVGSDGGDGADTNRGRARARSVNELSTTTPTSTADSRNGRSDPDVSRSRRDPNQPSDRPRTEPYGRKLAFEPPVHQHPHQSTRRGRHLGDDEGHNSPQVARQPGPSVEPEPTEPEERGPEYDKERVMGLVSQPLRPVPSPLAQIERDGERGASGRDVDGGTSRVIETAHDEAPPLGVPGPTGDGAVDDGEPDEHEQADLGETTSFGESSAGEGDGDAGEHVLDCAGERASVRSEHQHSLYSPFPPNYMPNPLDSQIAKSNTGILPDG
jgi:hypothetical protein